MATSSVSVSLVGAAPHVERAGSPAGSPGTTRRTV